MFKNPSLVGEGRHLLVIETEKFKHQINLEKPSYSIGRHPSNSIVINSKQVSRRHATIVRRTDSNRNFSYWILDGDLQGNKSSNGIFINGKKCQAHALKDGDIVQLGLETRLKYYLVNLEVSEASIKDSIVQKPPEVIPPKPEVSVSEKRLNSENILVDFGEKYPYSKIVKLASFPELSPYPIIEIDWQNHITYINPAAKLKFSDIETKKSDHPIVSELLSISQKTQTNLIIKEVKINAEIFEEYIHNLPQYQIIRAYIFDISEKKKAQQILESQSYYDSLTGLPNATLFSQQLSLALVNAQKNDQSLAILFLDIDRFKKINNSLGHSFGDQLLEKYAQKLRELLPSDYILGRWGGDEFVVLIPQIDNQQQVGEIGEKLLQQMKQAFQINKYEIHVTTSIGIAIYPHDGEDGETLLKNADSALHRIKEQGKNSYRFFSSTINAQNSEFLQLETLLYYALERNEFFIYYQPQINIKTGKIYGVEALLRWDHPDLGIVSPDKFINVAEENGLIIPIGEWVLQTACQQNKSWQELGLPPIRTSVNISPKQFQNRHVVHMVRQVLETTKLAPEFLELEITESSVIKNVERSRQLLQEFREIGVYLSMDDFGTGYSSLSYLQKFVFHELKIDKSFVSGLKEGSENVAIVSAVIALGQAFNLKVIAEGVETKEELDLLETLGCEQMQGFWFSEALKAEDITTLLSSPLLKS